MHRGAFARSCSVSATYLFLAAGCASTQLTANTVEVAAHVDDIYTRQVLENFSKFVDNEFAIPSQALLNTSQIQTTNTVQPNVNFPLSSQLLSSVAAAASGVTRTTSSTLAGSGASLQGVNSQQQNFTVAPLSDSITLRNQQSLYRHALFGTPLKGNYTLPRIFFNNRFYVDPYSIQFPQCVLCARQPYSFKIDTPVPALDESPALPGHWLYADQDSRKLRDPVDLGRFGAHELFMDRAAFAKGVLSSFVLFTLPYTSLTVVLSGPPTPQRPTVIQIIPTPQTNAPAGDHGGPGREGTLPRQATPPVTQYVLPPPAVSIPPATNQQLPPADRQNSIITINPSIIPPP